MIQINAAITTPDGGTIASGSVIDVTPHFKSQIVGGTAVQHDCMFDIDLYRSMADYEAGVRPVKTTFNEFKVGYTETGIDIAALNASAGAMDTMFGWLQTHIENGDGGDYAGVGASNTAIVYPTFP